MIRAGISLEAVWSRRKKVNRLQVDGEGGYV